MSQNKKRHYDKKSPSVTPTYQVHCLDKNESRYIKFVECKDKNGQVLHYECACSISGDFVDCAMFMKNYLEFHDEIMSKNPKLVKVANFPDDV